MWRSMGVRLVRRGGELSHELHQLVVADRLALDEEVGEPVEQGAVV
eukprot:CAMPEP_0179866872 /NCGR_PEP_ID=MMETSP0982-20121206/17783_1 /TAXON_ID=483367 /ORGANISM="non described non described, Strain CCMP 2436" /LENGTH=45 /DNA_ID= /DNA_START= /DNA_END= /DNA_ORIENTATION=